MSNPDPMSTALATLDKCDATLVRLDKMCCDPGRSPQMARLAETLRETRTHLGAGIDEADRALSKLEAAGSQLGRLQVGCCAPARMPLYSSMLEGFTEIQIAVNSARGQGH
ncbi:MAG: hypothetical protein HKN07_12370 [Acidimicrobiia bacterium]|nr:hypothetical protein [Acidimicrobiia bacterium]